MHLSMTLELLSGGLLHALLAQVQTGLAVATHHVVRGRQSMDLLGTLGRAGCSPCTHLRLAGPATKDGGLPWGGDPDRICPRLWSRNSRLPSRPFDGQAPEEKSFGAFLFQQSTKYESLRFGHFGQLFQ